jgi:hypothetical protein
MKLRGIEVSEEIQLARDKALAMVEEINAFIRYHFQDNSIYADKVVDNGVYATACADTLGIRERLIVTGGNDRIVVEDNAGQKITIDASNSTKLSNQMTRDYVLDKKKHTISTSSFAVVHQISTPLNVHKVGDGGNNGRYDYKWNNTSASRLKAFRKTYESYLYRAYDDTLKY